MKKIVKIKGMTCSHCTGRVEKMLKAIDGVENASADLENGSAVMNLASPVSDDLIREAVDDAGYAVLEITEKP